MIVTLYPAAEHPRLIASLFNPFRTTGKGLTVRFGIYTQLVFILPFEYTIAAAEMTCPVDISFKDESDN
jgi:hypothetical protein